MIEESLAIHRDLGNKSGVWRALDSLAHSLTQVSSEQGDYTTVRSLGEQSLAIVQELGDSSGIAFVRLTLGEIARLQGEYPLARSHYEQSLALGRALNDNYRIAETCSNLAYLTLNEASFTTTWAEGRAMSLAQAVAYALEPKPQIPLQAILQPPHNALHVESCANTSPR